MSLIVATCKVLTAIRSIVSSYVIFLWFGLGSIRPIVSSIRKVLMSDFMTFVTK